LSWLISSWVSIVESLNIVSDAVWNEVYRQRILLLSEDVRQWMKVWESLDWDKLFPPMMIQMIQVWEQTAKLDHTIVKVADFYDEQVDNTISSINKLLEPFIIVFLALVVWFIAMAIMQPIMNLADTVANS
jgi:type IV pilus assembly protein PilC